MEPPFAVLALYGTNGLTNEHREAIQSLPHLEEVIFALDPDEAGRKATQAVAGALWTLFLQWSLSTIKLPEDYDMNRFAMQNADWKAPFVKLIERVRDFLGHDCLESTQIYTRVKPDQL